MLLLGINLVRTRTVHLWIGLLLCVAAVAFPLSRIQRIEMVAHITDVLLLIPTTYLGISLLSNRSKFSLT
jgi:hypothetical protein